MDNFPDTLIGMTTEEMRAVVAEAAGLPAYRGSQIAEWYYRRILPGQGGGYAADFLQMTDLPHPSRAQLADLFGAPVMVSEKDQKDPRDGTIKVLARLSKGHHPIECVFLPDEKRVSVCLSTQAGCAMACAFCATGTQGLTRNLTAAEIISQYLLLQAHSPRRISHIVLMGMGEPLLNYDHVLRAIRILNAECGIAMRHITLSTVGIVPNIDKLAQECLQITLAVSLHAPNDALRQRLVPVAQTYSLERLMSSCAAYAAHTHRRLTFEYVLLKEVNDHPEEARELAQLVRGMPAAVNLIPYNSTSVTERFQRPEKERIAHFRQILEASGITVTQRKERGQQISAACGQLVTDTTRRKPEQVLSLTAGAIGNG